MRYSSKLQEKFAERGRIKVIQKVCAVSGYTKYVVKVPGKGDAYSDPNRFFAIEAAKKFAQSFLFAFNPRDDYKREIV